MRVFVAGAAEAEYRPLLFSIAYGMTGSAGDAEDIVQDAFLGLTRARQAGTMITDLKAYLTTAVTRLGINYLSSARVRRETYVGDWLPEPIVFTGASETLRLSGIDDDINTSGRYQAIKPRVLAMDRVAGADDIRRLLASPDVAVGSVAALTETGSLVVASGSGSQLPGYAGGAARAIWIVGAQKVVPDLSTALRRVEDHCLPLESARTQVAYGWPSAVNRLLVLNAEPYPGRGTVLLLREAIGF